ncbi:hypothetical protein K438DRAFT_1789192 [Mycena galopus ATCC 62051]|nr:hypothetical protein K438DRAFT_1789192 [Mycena galopus ATCC 62051]
MVAVANAAWSICSTLKPHQPQVTLRGEPKRDARDHIVAREETQDEFHEMAERNRDLETSIQCGQIGAPIFAYESSVRLRQGHLKGRRRGRSLPSTVRSTMSGERKKSKYIQATAEARRCKEAAHQRSEGGGSATATSPIKVQDPVVLYAASRAPPPAPCKKTSEQNTDTHKKIAKSRETRTGGYVTPRTLQNKETSAHFWRRKAKLGVEMSHRRIVDRPRKQQRRNLRRGRMKGIETLRIDHEDCKVTIPAYKSQQIQTHALFPAAPASLARSHAMCARRGRGRKVVEISGKRTLGIFTVSPPPSWRARRRAGTQGLEPAHEWGTELGYGRASNDGVAAGGDHHGVECWAVSPGKRRPRRGRDGDGATAEMRHERARATGMAPEGSQLSLVVLIIVRATRSDAALGVCGPAEALPPCHLSGRRKENRTFRGLYFIGSALRLPRVLLLGGFGFSRSLDRFAITLGMAGLPVFNGRIPRTSKPGDQKSARC